MFASLVTVVGYLPSALLGSASSVLVAYPLETTLD